MDPKKMAQLACDALSEKKAEDIKVIDIGTVSSLSDYFIIASGSNRNQVQAMIDNVEDALAKHGVYPKHIEGYRTGGWILLDYRDIVIHVFSEEERSFYDLERIWKDGTFIEIEDLYDDVKE